MTTLTSLGIKPTWSDQAQEHVVDFIAENEPCTATDIWESRLNQDTRVWEGALQGLLTCLAWLEEAGHIQWHDGGWCLG